MAHTSDTAYWNELNRGGDGKIQGRAHTLETDFFYSAQTLTKI